MFTAAAVMDTDSQFQTGAISITRASDAALTASSYTFTVAITVDTNTRIDSDNADNNNDNTNGGDDDADLTYAATVTVKVLNLTDNETVAFHLESGQIFAGNRISTFGKDIDLDPQVYELTGLGSSHKIVSAMVCDETEDNVDAVTDTCTADPEIGLGSPIGGTKYPLVIKNAAITGTAGGAVRVIVDTNTSKDSDGDDVKDNDADIIFAEDVTVAVIGGETTKITITEVEDLAADVTVKENVVAGHRFGRIAVIGALTGTGPNDTAELENLDGVITDSGRFIVRTNSRGPDSAGSTILALEYTGAEPIAAGEDYEMIVSVNGDTGFVNRTATSKVKVTVSAANIAPEAEAEQSNTVREDDPRQDFLIKKDSPVGTVSADDNESLTYSIATDADFEVDNDGVITAKRAIPAGESDNQADADADADDDIELEYTLDTGVDALTEWTYVNGETTSDTPLMDITRKVTVTVSDGVESNDQEVEFTVTIDVNEKVARITAADELPASPYEVTFEMVVRDLNDPATPDDADDDEATPTYMVEVRAGDRQTPFDDCRPQ